MLAALSAPSLVPQHMVRCDDHACVTQQAVRPHRVQQSNYFGVKLGDEFGLASAAVQEILFLVALGE
jgi:hypothetical protein